MSEARSRCERWHQQALAMLVVLACLAYGSALAGDYVFDDLHSVSANPALHDLGEFGRLLWDPTAFSGTGKGMIRPVLLVSFALNLALSPAAWSLKLGNLLLHVAVVMLAFGWLRRLHVPLVGRFVAMALLAVHPLVAETVNLVSARSELLLLVGLLLGVHGHLAWLRGRRPALAMLGMVVGTVVACGSKETGVVLPALLLAQAWVLRREPFTSGQVAKVLRDLLPVLVLVIAYLVLRKVMLGQTTTNFLSRVGGDPTDGFSRSMTTQLATMGLLVPRALLQTIVPLGLSFSPPLEFRHSFADPLVLAGWGGVLGLCVAAWCPGRGVRVRRMGMLLAGLTALPWIVVPLNMPFAEHRLYGPLLGVMMGLSPCLVAVHAWLRRMRAVHLAPWLRLLPLAAVVLVLATMSTSRSLDYRDERLLWRRELVSQPLAWRVWWGLGAAELRCREVNAAVAALGTAHGLKPKHFEVLRNYTEALLQLPADQQQPECAVARADELCRRSPSDPWVHALAAEANLMLGRATRDDAAFARAEALALRCLELGDAKALVFRLAAAARRELGDFEAALAHLDDSIARGLDFVPVRAERAVILHALGRSAQARSELRRLQMEAPFDPAVQQAMQAFAAPR